MTNNPDRRQRPISTSPTGPSPVRPPPFSSPGPSHRNQRLDDPGTTRLRSNDQPPPPGVQTMEVEAEDPMGGESQMETRMKIQQAAHRTLNWRDWRIGDVSLAKFKSLHPRGSKKMSQRFNTALRGRALLGWRWGEYQPVHPTVPPAQGYYEHE